MSYINQNQQQMQHGYPGYQKPPQNGGAGLKTCLIVGGILGAVGLVILVVCIIGMYMLGRTFREVADEATDRMEEATVADVDPDISSPSNFDEAIAYLNRSDERYHRVAADWLSRQVLDRSYQSRANKGLLLALASRNADVRRSALRALNTWGEPSASGEVAASLRAGDELNRDKLQLLGKWQRPVGSENIAKLLESAPDAENAYQALKRIGPPAAPYVAEYLSKRGSAGDYASRLVEEWGIDPEEALVQLYIDQLNDDNSSTRSSAAGRLATMEFDADVQPRVLEGIRLAQRGGNADMSDLMNVLLTWGDESCLSMVHDEIRDNAFDAESALQVAVKIRSPDSIPVIAAILDDFHKGEDAADALEGFGEIALDGVLEYANSDSDEARSRARRVANSVGVTDEQIIDQCIEDFETEESGRVTAAFDWIDTVEVDVDRRDEVASAMFPALDHVGHWEKESAADAFFKWVGPNQLDYLAELCEHRDEEFWRPAFRQLLIHGNPEDTKFVAGTLLTDFFKRDEALEEVQDIGPEIEPLIILMLEHNDEDVLIEMCRWLSVYGTERCVRPLERLADRARTAREIGVVQAAEAVRTEITARIRRENNAANDDSDGDDDSSDDDGSGNDTGSDDDG